MRHDCFVDADSISAFLFISSEKDKLLIIMSIAYKMLNCSYTTGPVSARILMFCLLKSHCEWLYQMMEKIYRYLDSSVMISVESLLRPSCSTSASLLWRLAGT
jgi:hypothetical protein